MKTSKLMALPLNPGNMANLTISESKTRHALGFSPQQQSSDTEALRQFHPNGARHLPR
jgi:hypothetical protein